MHVFRPSNPSWKMLAALFLTFIMALPIPLLSEGSQDVAGADDVDVIVPIEETSDNLIREEEVLEMGIPLPPDATRSEPWGQWERFSYHQSGESGVMGYNASSGRVYTFGGGYQSTGFGGQITHNTINDMFYFDINTQRWVSVEKATNPGGRYLSSYAVDEIRGKIYIYGGYMDGSMVNDLWVFDMDTEAWTRLASSVFTTRRAGAPMVIDPMDGDMGMLYIHMGKAQNDYDNLTGFYKIDISKPMQAPISLSDGSGSGLIERYDHDMCIDTVNKNIYLYGGRHRIGTDNNVYLNDFWVYNIPSDQWTQLSTHSNMESMVLHGSKMFFRRSGDEKTVNIWGGRQTMQQTTMNRTLWTYDADMQTWSFKHYASGDSPSGRMFYTAHYSTAADLFFVFQGRYYSGQYSYRYRNLNYMTMTTKQWTRFPLNTSVSSVNGGIFAHNEAQQRLYYIGPNTLTSGNYSGYIYYFDLMTRDWKGPIYNPSSSNPGRRSNAGICYVPDRNEVFIYGGGYTTRQGQTTYYYNRDDMWKIDLDTFEWSVVWAPAGPGPRQGFDMVHNTKDGKIYFYGGYYHPTTSSDRIIYDDFYSFDPASSAFSKINPSGTTPGMRYGAALMYEPDDHLLYLFGGWYLKDGGANPQEENDLWTYDFSTQTWTNIDAQFKPSSRAYSKLSYDPLTREIIMTGGSENNDMSRYRIMEGKWYPEYYLVNPGNLDNHAAIFIPETRDLWLYGSGRHGMWRFGIPFRLAIQRVSFADPSEGANVAYSMLKPYRFTSMVKAVEDVSEISEVRYIFNHRDGAFSVIYNHTQGTWVEHDPGNRAFLVDQTVSVDGVYLNLDMWIRFNWTWTNRPNIIDRSVTVRIMGYDVAPDELIVRNFLTVRNQLELRGVLSVSSEVQGPIQNQSWIRAGEWVNFMGPVVAYIGADLYPPLDSYEFIVWDEDDEMYTSSHMPGEPINVTLVSPATTKTNYRYKFNITGVPPDTDTSDLSFRLSTDADPPGKPPTVIIHADDLNDQRTRYDNDTEVFLSWQSAPETASGVIRYYWAFEDRGGTRNGNPVESRLDAVVELPGKGLHTLYVWAEDLVGNIGPAESAQIMIDTEPTTFNVIRPNLDEIIPYTAIDFEINMTDKGGSTIISQSVMYRFSNNGLNDPTQWLAPAAWKFVQDIWTSFHQEHYQFVLNLKGLSDSYDNYIQFKCQDGAGTVFTSAVFNIVVDTSLRYPIATLISPQDGTDFEDPDDVTLEWNVTFFDPDDVSYKIYISNRKLDVLELKSSVLWTEVFRRTSYEPIGLDFGTYYWTVVPVAQGKFIGNCTNGVFSFSISNEENYAFTISSTVEKIKLQQGTPTSILSFDLANIGQKPMNITPTIELEGHDGPIGSLIRYEWLLIRNGIYHLEIQQELVLNLDIEILLNATVGNYTLNITFVSSWGIVRNISIPLEITQRAIKVDPPKEDPIGLYIFIGIILILLIMMVLGGLYYILVKRKAERSHRDIESELSQLEDEYGMASVTGARIAPQPKGLGTTSSPKKSTLTEHPSSQAQAENTQQEAPTLVDETSEDAWMNIVASETIQEVSTSETIEKDKAVSTDKEKSLHDLLMEMSED